MAPRHDDDVPAARADATEGGRLRGTPALKLHLTLAAGLALCIGAFVFEVGRALGGNTLSWAYVFEWPIFAAFAVYMWWNLLHETDGRSRKRPAAAAPTGPAVPDVGGDAPADAPGSPVDDDPDLAAWQAYLRTMEEDERRQAREDGSA